jgi:ribosome biogenesis protein
MDHTVRRWDVEAGGGACADTLNTARAVHCLAACPAQGSRLVAFGGAERAVRIWDPRAKGPEGQISVKNYLSHKEWVSAISWCPGSEHHLATGSYDGTIKVWDTRAGVPLGTVEAAHEGKVLALDWFAPTAIASGGSDCKLKVHAVDSL